MENILGYLITEELRPIMIRLYNLLPKEKRIPAFKNCVHPLDLIPDQDLKEAVNFTIDILSQLPRERLFEIIGNYVMSLSKKSQSHDAILRFTDSFVGLLSCLQRNAIVESYTREIFPGAEKIIGKY